MQYELWHPLWILFITIPLFYIIANPIDKYEFKTKKDDGAESERVASHGIGLVILPAFGLGVGQRPPDGRHDWQRRCQTPRLA